MQGLVPTTALLVLLASFAGCARSPEAPRPPTAEQLYQRGLYLAAQGDDFSAEQYLIEARAAGYPEPEVMREIVRVCLQGGRLEQALVHGHGYVERHPEDWIFHHVLGSIYVAKGDGVRARHELELLLSEHPEHAESHYLLGVLLRDEYADVPGARRALEQYLALAPTGEHAGEARAWVRRAESYPTALPSEGGP